MKKMILMFISLIIILASCTNGSLFYDVSDINQQKVHIKIRIEDSRSVLPNEIDKTVLNYTLIGYFNNVKYDLGNFIYNELFNTNIELFVGQWKFVLTANDGVQDVLTGTLLNYNVTTGSNVLSFTLSECATGTGNLDVFIKYPRNKIAKINAVLTNLSDEIVIDEEYLAITDCTNDNNISVSEYIHSEIPKGYYSLILRLYQSYDDEECINQRAIPVRIEPGCLSSGAILFDKINSYWAIIYHYEGIDLTGDAILPHSYNIDSSIVLPTANCFDSTSDLFFYGWYDNADLSGDKITFIDYDSTGDKEYWAKTKSGIAVTSDDFEFLLSSLDKNGGPYNIILTESNPDMDKIKSAMQLYPNTMINLDMTLCNEFKSLNNQAFYNCYGLCEIFLPNCVTSIGASAFYGCRSLNSINIPNGVIDIGNSAFYRCSNLTNVLMPNTLKNIGGLAFCYCSALKTIVVPNSVINIGNSAFSSCNNLEQLTVPFIGKSEDATGTESYFHSIFGSDGSSIPSNLQYLKITRATRITGWAFSYSYSGLTTISIPSTLTKVYSNAFIGCSSLTKIEYEGTIEQWCDIEFEDTCANPLWRCHNLYIDGEYITNLIIPDSVEVIRQYAFVNCTSFENLTLSENIKCIGDYAFYGCSGLTKISIPSNILSIGNFAFNNCTSLASITVKAIVPPVIGSGENDFLDGTSQMLKIYVPAISIDSYKMSNGWGKYADKIYAIED